MFEEAVFVGRPGFPGVRRVSLLPEQAGCVAATMEKSFSKTVIDNRHLCLKFSKLKKSVAMFFFGVCGTEGPIWPKTILVMFLRCFLSENDAVGHYFLFNFKINCSKTMYPSNFRKFSTFSIHSSQSSFCPSFYLI